MSERIGNLIIISEEPEENCALCGEMAELRPYGPNYERIFFECGMTNVATTTMARMGEVLFGDGRPV